MIQKTFDICIDNDNVEILDFIFSLFNDENYFKTYEITVSVKEIDYTDDGSRVYVDE